MKRIMTLSLAGAALGLAVAASPALYAQDRPGGGAPQTPGVMDHGGMAGGDMGGMMKMMGQMSQMMEQCSRMMQSMNSQPAPGRSDQPRETPPANPGSRG